MRRMLAAALALLALTGCAYLKFNERTVAEDQLLRSGQMPAEWLGKTIEREDVGTVVNLRGADPEDDWYMAEAAVCEAKGVPYYSMGWTMRRPPDPESLAEYLDILETAEKPILVHCQGGTHRAGAASAIYVLAEGGTPDEAREQFTLFFFDAPIGAVVDWYEETGDGVPFPQWARETYPALYAERIAAG